METPPIHELKTDPIVFHHIAARRKLFEIRKNDRPFGLGDILVLRQTVYTGEQMRAGNALQYSGNEVVCRVLHILKGPVYGLADGWCIMSIEVLLTSSSPIAPSVITALANQPPIL